MKATGMVVALALLFACVSGCGHRCIDTKQEAAARQMKQFCNAVDMYRLENNRYPDSLQDLVRPPADAKKRESFVDQIDKDPWGHDYVYRLTPGGKRPYEIVSYGADGAPGGDGDNADITSYDDWAVK